MSGRWDLPQRSHNLAETNLLRRAIQYVPAFESAKAMDEPRAREQAKEFLNVCRRKRFFLRDFFDRNDLANRRPGQLQETAKPILFLR